MRDVLIIFIHLIVTAARVMRPDGIRSVIAKSVLLRHQLLVLNRPRQRAPELRPIDRIVAGLCAELVRPARLLRSAIVLKPATILNFHRLLVKRKRLTRRFGELRDLREIPTFADTKNYRFSLFRPLLLSRASKSLVRNGRHRVKQVTDS